MAENFKRRRRHKSTSKVSIILPLICLLLLSAAMWTNSITKNYENQIVNLSKQIKAAKDDSDKIKSKNKDLEALITELDLETEKIEAELN